MKVFKIILRFMRDTAYFMVFLLRLLWSGSFSNPFKGASGKHTGTAAVLANGPSLKEVIPKLTGEEFSGVDFIVMNFFAFDEMFFKIKPKHYCLADPIFWTESYRIGEVRKLYMILQNQVAWELNVYIPKAVYKTFLAFSGLTNKNIKIIKVNNIEYTGYMKLRNFFYRKGIAMPRAQTVAILAIYVGLNGGYSTLNLYGVDHNFFHSLCVNDKNQLCSAHGHFYQDTKLEPIRDGDGSIFKISFYLDCLAWMFKGHDVLAEYAKYLNVKIINCTIGSMIDSYERLNTRQNV